MAVITALAVISHTQATPV